MPRMTVYIPDDLVTAIKDNEDQGRHYNWSWVAQQAIRNALKLPQPELQPITVQLQVWPDGRVEVCK